MDREAWLTSLHEAVRKGRIEWRQHALTRLLMRGIALIDVERALLEGEVIEFYPEAYPLPAALLLHVQDQPLHVVAAVDPRRRVCYVITAYRPNPDRFEPDWKTRKST